MKNIIKTILVMLSVVSFSAAQAGELSVTGSAKASYSVHSSDSTSAKVSSSKALGVANEFNLGATGELDNGTTWKYNVNIDGATVQDDGGLSLTHPTLGSVAINISQGGLDLSTTPALNANGNRGSDIGFAEGMIQEHSIGDMNNVQYHTPAGLLPLGVAIKLAYAPDTAAAPNNSVNAIGGQNNGTFVAVPTATNTIGTSTATTQGSNIGRTMSSYQVTAAPIDGLKVGVSYSEFGGVVGATAQAPESGSAHAIYAVGPATISYGKAWIAPALGTAQVTNFVEFFDNTTYALSVNANENFSVAYTMEKSEANYKTAATATVELETSTISAAYTIGGMTLAIAQASHDNVGYIANNNAKSTIFNVSMAF